MQTPTGGEIPTCHTLNWQCPTLLEATPGAHQRMLSQGQVGRSWCHRKASGSAKSSSGSLPHSCKILCFCLNTAFSSLYFRSLLVILTGGCLTSRTAVWDQYALSPFGKPSHTATDGAAPTLAGGASRLFAMGRLSQNTTFVQLFADTDIYKQSWIGWGELYCRQEWGILWLVSLICIFFKKLQSFHNDLCSSACFELLLAMPNIRFINPQSSDVSCIHVVFQYPRIYY